MFVPEPRTSDVAIVSDHLLGVDQVYMQNPFGHSDKKHKARLSFFLEVTFKLVAWLQNSFLPWIASLKLEKKLSLRAVFK